MEPTGDQPPLAHPSFSAPESPEAAPLSQPPSPISFVLNPGAVGSIVVETDPARRSRLILQVAVILSLAVIPDVLSAIAGRLQTAPFAGFTHMGLLANFSRCVRVIVPALYILLSSGETWSSIGLRRPRIFVDAGLGILLFSVVYMSAIAGHWVGHQTGEPFHGLPRSHAPMGNLILIIPELAANSVAEELAIWGFLSTRLRKLSANPAIWLLLPALTFSSYHIYQSATAVTMIFITGLLHGGMFWLTGRLWPSVVAHTLSNLYAVLMSM